MSRTLRSPLHIALMRVLKEARLSAGLTQTELANRLGRPQSYVAKTEVGERQLSVVEFIPYAEALGLAPGELVERVAGIGGSRQRPTRSKGTPGDVS